MASRKTRTPKTQQTQAPALEPTTEQIEAAVAKIDDHMETASVAGIVDHVTQLDSWHDANSTAVFEQIADQGLLDEVVEAEPVQTADALTAAADAFPDLYGPLTAEDIEAAVSAAPSPAVVEDTGPTKLEALVDAQDDGVVGKTVFFIEAQITGREKFEEDKSTETGKTNIFSTLKKVRNQMVTKRVAAILNACDVDPGFINRTLHDGSRYNVYALGKLSDIVFGVSGGAVANAINLAIIKSLFKCREAEIPFTKEIAKACCSKQLRVDAKISKVIERQTVSPSTAPTQASSFMQALATLGVVDVQGSTRAPIYQLTDRPLTRKLEAMLAAA